MNVTATIGEIGLNMED